MHIVLVGRAAFAEKVLDRLRERQHDVVAVYRPPESHQRPDPVKTRALALAIPMYQHRTLKGTDVQRDAIRVKRVRAGDSRDTAATFAAAHEITPGTALGGT